MPHSFDTCHHKPANQYYTTKNAKKYKTENAKRKAAQHVKSLDVTCSRQSLLRQAVALLIDDHRQRLSCPVLLVIQPVLGNSELVRLSALV